MDYSLYGHDQKKKKEKKSKTSSTPIDLYVIPHIFYTWIIPTHCLQTLTGYYIYIYISLKNLASHYLYFIYKFFDTLWGFSTVPTKKFLMPKFSYLHKIFIDFYFLKFITLFQGFFIYIDSWSTLWGSFTGDTFQILLNYIINIFQNLILYLFLFHRDLVALCWNVLNVLPSIK